VPQSPISESAGVLASVTKWLHDGHDEWHCAYVLDFEGEVLCLEVDPATHILHVGNRGPTHDVGRCRARDVSSADPWRRWIGEDFTTMWRLDDTRAGPAGWQIEFTHPVGPAEVVQLLVVQGGLNIWLVTETRRP
jgi:hypothetical protein